MSPLSLLLSVFLLASLVSAGDKDGKREFPEGTQIVHGKRGHKTYIGEDITIETPYGKPDYIDLIWGEISELDANYNMLKTMSIPSRIKDWTKPTDFTYPDLHTGQDIIVTMTQFSKQLRNGAVLDATVWIMTTHSATISWNSIDIPVPVNSVKMSFNISDWPFQSGSNLLSVGLKLESSGGKKHHPVVKRHKHFHKLNFGIGILESITSALYDSIIPGPVQVNVGPVEDNSVSVEYVFYAFNKQVNYDPVFSANSAYGVSLSSFSIISLLLLTIYFIFN